MTGKKRMTTGTAEVQNKARAAVSEFRKIQPTLTAFARHLTGNPRVAVQVSAGVPRTDGKVIHYQPPIELGENRRHQTELCDRRDPATKQQLCDACRIREGIMATIYHEISHIAFQSFLEPEAAHIREAVGYIKALVNPGYAEKIMRRIVNAPQLPKSYMELSAAINPYFKSLVNCLEDVRINHQMHRARPGTKAMMDAQIWSVMTDGIKKGDGSVVKWTDMHLNQQVSIGAYLVASGFEVNGWLAPEVKVTLDTDQRLRDTLSGVIECETVHEAFQVSWDVFTQLRAHGYYETTEEQEEQSEDDTADEDDSNGAGGTPPPVPTPQPQQPTPSGDSSDEDESAPKDAGDTGAGSGDNNDAGATDSADEDEEGEQPEEAADDSADSGDSRSEAGSEGEASDEGEAASADEADESEADDSESSASDGGSAPLGEGDDTDPSDAGSGDDEDAEDAAPAEPGDAEEVEGDADGDGDDSDADAAPADAADAEGSDDSPFDSGEAEAGPAVTVQPDADAEDFDLEDLGLHAHAEPSTEGEELAVETAIVQGEYFEKPSVHIKGVNEWRYEDAAADQLGRDWHAWGNVPDYMRSAYGIDFDPVPEAVLAPALMRMRLVFADNKRTQRNRNQRSGRLDNRVLGRRAWAGDDRLFGKKVVPGKKDYLVIIGLDISGSTAHGGTGGEPNLVLIKQAAMAQADLCARTGVPFAVYAHTGSPTNESEKGRGFGNALMSVDIYHIKDENEMWDDKARQRLMDIGPSWANVDGHTLEFYRKVADKHTATHKIIMYYTDGKMPMENFHEELEILQREIATCKQKGYTLLGVGIRTDSPRAHGLDTVEVYDSGDVGKVVTHLERVLVV